MAYTHLLFDADDTLFDFRLAEKEDFFTIWKQFGGGIDPSIAYPVYHEENKKAWKELEENLCTREELVHNRFARTFAKLGQSADIPACQIAYAAALAENGFLYPQALPLLEELKRKYTLALITNGSTKIQRRRIEKSGLKDYFEYIFISEEMGVSKPSAAFFEQVLSALKIENKSKALVIGDSLNSDILGAQNACLDACWLAKENATPGSLSPKYIIHSLDELRNLLGK